MGSIHNATLSFHDAIEIDELKTKIEKLEQELKDKKDITKLVIKDSNGDKTEYNNVIKDGDCYLVIHDHQVIYRLYV